ncbi:hypothetical protein [Hymenobacter cavernae]|nr:hypothetical protein [Hymenobacter cavernae]
MLKRFTFLFFLFSSAQGYAQLVSSRALPNLVSATNLALPATVPQQVAHPEPIPVKELTGSVAKLDEQRGFQNATLDQELASFQDLISEPCSTTEGADVSCYTRSTDVLALGTARLEKIQYTFYKKSLAAIIVTLKGAKNIAAFRQVLEETYGPGTPSPESLQEVEWSGERVHMAYNVLRGETKQEPILRLVLRSKAQMARYQADQVAVRRATPQTDTGDL